MINRVLIFGIDGATLDLIRPWAEAGYLPNLGRLMADGVQGDLESTLPPVTSPAWPTFMTGCNPGKHGVFDFIRPQGDGFCPGQRDQHTPTYYVANTLRSRPQSRFDERTGHLSGASRSTAL